jgi:lysophospholipase L1-like esterase
LLSLEGKENEERCFMPLTRWLWRTIGTVSVIGTLLLAAGFVYAVKTVLNPSGTIAVVTTAEESAFENEASIEIVGLGDSLTVGYGDATGKGYVRGLQERLQETMNVPVYVLANFAQNGYTTSQVLSDLQEREGIAEALKKADVIVMTVGSNDLMKIGNEVDADTFHARIPETEANIRRILATIRDITTEAHIYYIGLYNPFIEYKEIQGTTLAVQAWNEAVFAAMEPYDNVTFVPTFDMFQQGGDRFLSSDRYHLNEDGYARIAARLAMLME